MAEFQDDGRPDEEIPTPAAVVTRRPISPAEDAVSLLDEGAPIASTPLRDPIRPSTLCHLSPCMPQEQSSSAASSSGMDTSSCSVLNDTEVPIQAPILGFEVMEERARFTVFKIQIQIGPHESWFLFRRYSDFHRLNEQLRFMFPHFRLALPPKNWFGDNFDRNFLDDRILGLQAFVNNVLGHKDICMCEPVRLFFCLDDPPGPHDSLEESRALCDILEHDVFQLKHDAREKDEKITLLEDEMALHKIEVENLKKALRIERSLNRRSSPCSQHSECSLPEHEQTVSGATGDLSDLAPSAAKLASLVIGPPTQHLSKATTAAPLPNGRLCKETKALVKENLKQRNANHGEESLGGCDASLMLKDLAIEKCAITTALPERY